MTNSKPKKIAATARTLDTAALKAVAGGFGIGVGVAVGIGFGGGCGGCGRGCS